MKIIMIPILSVVCLYACMSENKNETGKINPLRNETENRGKPSDKEVLLLVMQSNEVLLTVDSSCSGVGSEFSDSTIGQYLSGFWQFHTDSTTKNLLQINVQEGIDESIKEKHWNATFLINGQTEKENWSWGISFIILDKNRSVLKNSIRCIGAG